MIISSADTYTSGLLSSLPANSDSATSENSSTTSSESVQEKADPNVRTEPGQKLTKPDGSPRDSFELSREAEEIRQLQARDKEVRAHEAAHAAAGGSYAGSPSYSFSRGPDGRSYATGGEVSIDISPIPGDPEATLQKASQVRSAALAPVQPSAQDMRVASRALAMTSEARQTIASEASAELNSVTISDEAVAKQGSAVAPDVGDDPIAGGGMTSLDIFA